jgi:hypothetical protein
VTEFVQFRDESVPGHRKIIIEQEYKESACEDLTYDLRTLCVLQHSDIGCDFYSSCVINL